MRPTISGAYQRGLGVAARAEPACRVLGGGVYTDFLRTFDFGTAAAPSGHRTASAVRIFPQPKLHEAGGGSPTPVTVPGGEPATGRPGQEVPVLRDHLTAVRQRLRWPSRVPRGRRSAWVVLVPVVALLAGLLFATSGQTARGTDLRGGEVIELSGLISQRRAAVAEQGAESQDLQEQVDRLTGQVASQDGAVAGASQEGDDLTLSAGLVPLTGRGVRITLDDAPRRPDGSLPRGARPDDVVIHQSDVQAVVNALWAGGADGVAIMDQRLIATSAVRCVGNVLLLEGRTYSPPFQITAVGDVDAFLDQLAASPQVAVFQDAVAAFGLTFSVRGVDTVQLPAHTGVPTMEYATPVK